MIDYSIHSWDIKVGLGRDEPLSDDAAITLIPFMLIVIQYTVDAERSKGVKCKFGIDIEGSGGGTWAVDVDGTTVNIVEGSTEGCADRLRLRPERLRAQHLPAQARRATER